MKLRRRAFLGGVGAGAMALPFLRATQARAAANTPKRLVVWFTPDGTIRDEWFPAAGATERNFTLKRILEPLNPWKDRLILPDNITLKSRELDGGGPGDGHQQGMGHMLTGAWLLPGSDMGGCDSCSPADLASAISIDQRIANQVATPTNLRKSLELSIQHGGGGATAWNRMSYRGPGDALEPNNDPRDVFNKLFGNVNVDDEAAKKRAFFKKSVLDTVKNDFARIDKRLGAAERRTLELHREGVLEIERRLGLVRGACATPELGPDVNVEANENFPAVGKMQMDLALRALGCDLTRVVSLMWSRSVGDPLMTWVNVNGSPLPNDKSMYGQHTLSHLDDQAFAKEALTQVNRWYAQQLAYFLDQLATTDEPDGSGKLIDNTIVLWVNELGEGRPHNETRMPFLMAGNVGGYFDTGRYLVTNKASQNDLYVSLCNAYGIDTNTFGDSRFCSGAVAGLAK